MCPLQSRYYSLYDLAQQNCWLVCIPVAVSLQPCTINRQFVGKVHSQLDLAIGKYLLFSTRKPPSGTIWAIQRVSLILKLQHEYACVVLCSVYGASGPSRHNWRLSGKTLHCVTNKKGSYDYSVQVLSEELAFNKSLKQFKMFITDRPLDPDYKVLMN